MELREAQRICREIEAEATLANKFGTIKWESLYNSEEELIADLSKVFLPKKRFPPHCTFKAYEFVYSAAYYVQHGWKLSPKQMTAAKRVALEIKKAAAIADYQY